MSRIHDETQTQEILDSVNQNTDDETPFGVSLQELRG